MDPNKIAEILAAERAQHRNHPEGIDVPIRYSLDRLTGALADYFDAVSTNRMCDCTAAMTDYPCDDDCNIFYNRAEFLRTARGG